MAYRLSTAGKIAVCSVYGIVDPLAALDAFARHAETLERTRPLVSVACYDQARIDVSAEALLLAAKATLVTAAARAAPAAIVVTPDALPMWERYASLTGARGMLRSLHTSFETAWNWAAEHAALIEADARWLASRRR